MHQRSFCVYLIEIRVETSATKSRKHRITVISHNVRAWRTLGEISQGTFIGLRHLKMAYRAICSYFNERKMEIYRLNNDFAYR